MRITAYILLLLGFLWLTLLCGSLSVWSLTRNLGIQHFERYPETRQYTGHEVCDALRSFIDDYQNRIPGVVLPATLMLGGGILLDVAGRRRADARRLTTRSSEQALAVGAPL